MQPAEPVQDVTEARAVEGADAVDVVGEQERRAGAAEETGGAGVHEGGRGRRAVGLAVAVEVAGVAVGVGHAQGVAEFVGAGFDHVIAAGRAVAPAVAVVEVQVAGDGAAEGEGPEVREVRVGQLVEASGSSRAIHGNVADADFGVVADVDPGVIGRAAGIGHLGELDRRDRRPQAQGLFHGPADLGVAAKAGGRRQPAVEQVAVAVAQRQRRAGAAGLFVVPPAVGGEHVQSALQRLQRRTRRA